MALERELSGALEPAQGADRAQEGQEDEDEGPGFEASIGRRSLRKRQRTDASQRRAESLEQFWESASSCRNVLVFSGSGMSAAAGMSTFSSRGGLYEKAAKRFKISSGAKLFHYNFFARNRKDCQSFLAEIFFESEKAQPTGKLPLFNNTSR